jgi:hypothetical protein
MTHLFVAITPHGFGHAAQLAPVLGALCRRLPGLSLTLASTLPESFLRGRLECDFRYLERAADFGLVMHSALAIDLDASAARYAQLHENWKAQVDAEARFLETQQADLVLADVPYLTLAGAGQVGIPAFALCSLNWADIYRHYFSDRREAGRVLDQMEAAYASAQTFFCPQPSMPMAFLDNTQSVGPIARQGRDQQLQLREMLGLKDDAALILIAPGGINTRFPVESWPRGQGIHWLVSDDWQVEHPDVSPISQTGLTFTDLLASCDGVLGKCGYGTVAECVVNGTPLLYIPRPDWPEERSLLDWLVMHQAAVRVEPEWLKSGDLRDPVEQALGLDVDACDGFGEEQVAEALAGFLHSMEKIHVG